MDRLVVTGGTRLHGSVRISGAKNSALKLMAASLLAEGETVIENVPHIADCLTMAEVLEQLGAGVAWEGSSLRIDASGALGVETPYELVSQMRASIVVLGPLLARQGRARVAMPGGCNIGSRKIDLHLKGFERMGARFSYDHGFLNASAPSLRGAMISLDFPSVGATENILMAAVGATGTTVIENAAREPEIQDLAAMLVQMGAKIDGAGSTTMEIHGVDGLHVRASPRHPRPHRGGYLRHRGVRDRRSTSRSRTRAPSTWTWFWPSWPTPARPSTPRRHPARRDGRTPRGGRLRHAALSRVPDRPPAADDGAAGGRARHEHRHRERLREPVHVRRRAEPDGGGHPDRGPSRGDPRRRTPVGRAGPRAGHPRRRGDGHRGALGRRHDRDRRHLPRGPGYEDLEGRLASLGAEVHREPSPWPAER